ncbi:MAG: response regulator [Ignavibacteria bacterium]|nr:response regulator [Ignavibacteria bacterium]
MTEQIKILLVEDNFEHLNLTKYLLRDNNVPGDVHVVRDGQEALDYLYQKNKFSDTTNSPRPSVVLLDLNLPRVDGKEVLKIIKSDEVLKDIPVIVVSSSDREEDVSYASMMGAAAYINKSGGFEQLSKALASIQTYVIKP